MLYQIDQFAFSVNMLDQFAERDGITLDWADLSVKNQKHRLFSILSFEYACTKCRCGFYFISDSKGVD